MSNLVMKVVHLENACSVDEISVTIGIKCSEVSVSRELSHSGSRQPVDWSMAITRWLREEPEVEPGEEQRRSSGD